MTRRDFFRQAIAASAAVPAIAHAQTKQAVNPLGVRIAMPELETASPTKDIVADTRANIEYVKKTFRMP